MSTVSRDLRATLTNTAIDRLLPGEELKDDRVPGLSVRCNATTRSFMLYYRTRDGIARRPRIGTYGQIGLSQARDIARSLLGRVAAGEDPSRARAEARGEPDVAALWERVKEEHYGRGRAWDKEAARLYAAGIGPKLGKLRVKAVTTSDVETLHRGLKASPTTANRTLAVISKMMALAERWGLRDLGTNPCQHVPRFKETSRRRFATAEELAKIGAFLEREAPTHPRAVAFLYLLLYSGARPSEIERVTWQQLDGNVLRIAEGKTGYRAVFLPEQAMAVLHTLKRINQDYTRERIVGQGVPRALWRRIRKEIGAPDLWARDLRRTFATVGYSAGVDKHMVGDLLGHRDPKTTAIYAKLMEEPAAAASAAIANRMAELLKPKEKIDARVDIADLFAD